MALFIEAVTAGSPLVAILAVVYSRVGRSLARLVGSFARLAASVAWFVVARILGVPADECRATFVAASRKDAAR
jgi:hypothetical protein